MERSGAASLAVPASLPTAEMWLSVQVALIIFVNQFYQTISNLDYRDNTLHSANPEKLDSNSIETGSGSHRHQLPVSLNVNAVAKPTYRAALTPAKRFRHFAGIPGPMILFRSLHTKMRT